MLRLSFSHLNVRAESASVWINSLLELDEGKLLEKFSDRRSNDCLLRYLSAEQEVDLSRRIHAGAEAAHILQADRQKYGAPEYDKHRSDPDTTQEEKDAIEDIRIIRRIKLRDADQTRAVARATWEAYLDAAELADYFPNYNISSKAW